MTVCGIEAPPPTGKYVGGAPPPKPYLRIEADFNVGKVHLSVSCGPTRAKWDAWLDLVQMVPERMYFLKNYQANPKYKEYLTFFTNNCGRGSGQAENIKLHKVYHYNMYE
ncbi:hypothetical protein FOL47_002917 [Perkinsus chesapeaki]|uniref:Uncharacterized protein n=1 Tax=Perkinsus chesapeaki TaxID=330153 RepID=A0A7J6MB86_PERCH|nr:hypothetical protein FOL47_002917 [Perkinsus chesapeaki]